MQNLPRPPGQSQLVCGGCRTLLMYPQGAQNVRCARCSHITAVPSPVNQESTMAQLQCNNPSCRVTLMYPRGALQVQCSLCGTLNDAQQANQLGHVVCGGCQTTLMYAYGAQSVKCAVCNHVTPCMAGTRPPPVPQPLAYQPPSYPQPPYPMNVAGPPSGFPPPAQQPPQASLNQSSQGGTGLSGGSNPKPVQAVLVENPPTLDEGGNELPPNVALGVKKEGDRSN